MSRSWCKTYSHWIRNPVPSHTETEVAGKYPAGKGAHNTIRIRDTQGVLWNEVCLENWMGDTQMVIFKTCKLFMKPRYGKSQDALD
jgi:hypothetical protein